MKNLSLLLAFGCTLCCFTLAAQEEEYGLASYYSEDFQGRSTAYGDIYNKDELTCAHKRYPYGTMLKVTRLDNKKSVNVKVTDKGPFIKGRVVDLSHRAAEILGMIGLNTVEVKVERLSNTSTRTADTAPIVRGSSATTDSQPQSFDEPTGDRIVAPDLSAKGSSPATASTAAAPATTAPAKPTEPAPTATPNKTTIPVVKQSTDRFSRVGDDYTPFGLYRIVLEKPDSQTGFGVQIASFSNYENLLQKVADLQAKWFDNILISIEPGTGGNNSYKVILGPFDTQKGAQHYQESLVSRYKINGFVLDLAGLKY